MQKTVYYPFAAHNCVIFFVCGEAHNTQQFLLIPRDFNFATVTLFKWNLCELDRSKERVPACVVNLSCERDQKELTNSNPENR